MKGIRLISSHDESNYLVYFAVGQHKFSNQMVGLWKKSNLPKEGRLDSTKNPTKRLDITKNPTDHGWTSQKIRPDGWTTQKIQLPGLDITKNPTTRVGHHKKSNQERLDNTKNPTKRGWITQKIQPTQWMVGCTTEIIQLKILYNKKNPTFTTNEWLDDTKNPNNNKKNQSFQCYVNTL